MASSKAKRLRVLMLAIGVGAALTATACSGSSGSSGAHAGSGAKTASPRGGTLTVGMNSAPLSMDPGECAPIIYCNLTYEALVQIIPGTSNFEPGLATSWAFTDSSHQTMRLALRAGVKFTDGSALTGPIAAASINALLGLPGPFGAAMTPIAKASAAGPDAVQIHYSRPVTERYALFQLAGQSGAGMIVGPQGVANRKILTTSSDGIGPYKLDPSQTVAGTKYTFVPNADYYNQSAIKYDKIVVQPVTNAQSRLSAIQSGQVDWAANLPERDIPTIKSAGLQISTGQVGSLAELDLANRASGPLASQQVRQAVSYAIPRSQITNAIYGATAIPTSSAIVEGSEGYNPADTGMYSYNAAKAKSLLAAAGYATGFSMTVLDPTAFDPGGALGQALSQSLAAIGITVKLQSSDAPEANVAVQIVSGHYDAFVLADTAEGLSAMQYQQLSAGAVGNPYKMPSDPQLDTLMNEAALAAPAQQDALTQRATTRLDQLAWIVSIADVPSVQALVQSVKNVPATFYTSEGAPVSPVTGQNWYTSG